MKSLILLLGLIFLISACAKVVDCNSDIECFKINAETCSKSKFLLSHDGNDILITLRGRSNEKCGISFKVIDVSNEIKNKYPTESSGLKGNTLNCLVPIKYKDPNNWVELIGISEKIDEYCFGQIKDLAKGPLKAVLLNKFNNMLTK